MAEFSKKGYLKSDFRVFHLVDENLPEIDFHYHDFHKLLIHLRGNTSYCISGQTFDLAPGDIVFVNAGEVHRPIFHDGGIYERIIIYISPNFLEDYKRADGDLTLCFKRAQDLGSRVLRVPSFFNSKLGSLEKSLEHALSDDSYANELYLQLLFLEFMVGLNRAAISQNVEFISTNYSNSKIAAIVDYIDGHLNEDLSVDYLAGKFYMSRYHLMHSFKDTTGYTIGDYISAKRLSIAQEMIASGQPIVEASLACGYKTYSSFLRAYKKHFGYAPSSKKASDATLRF